MKKKILVSILLLVCFWHFNVRAEELVTDVPEVVAGEVTEEVQEEETEEKEKEVEVVSSDPSPGNVENSENVFSEEKEEEVVVDETNEEEKTEEKNISEETEENTALTSEEENNVETDNELVEVDNNINNDIEEPVEEPEVISEENEVVPEELVTDETTTLENNEDESTDGNYGVNFSSEGYVLGIPGGSNILLSEVLSKHGINISLSDIEKVEFSNGELLKVNKLDNGDYNLESLTSFETEESLVIYLSDGSTISLKVTDPEPPKKTLTDNGDGTYTLELTVTGDATNQTEETGNVNVVVVYDISQSMTNSAGSSNYSRADQAEDVVHDFLANLKRYQNKAKDNINVSLVTFAKSSTQVQGWTTNVESVENRFDDDGTDGHSSFTYTDNSNFGTNWEAALQRAQTLVNNLNNNYPTFVILITDGAPTASGANGNNSISPVGARIESLRPFYEAATNEAEAIANAVGPKGTFYGIYAYGTEADLLDDLMYYSVNGEHRGGSTNNVVAATSTPHPNYFNAGETAQLQAAIDEIFDKVVQAMGISSAVINDGTTSNVTTSTGEIAKLLEVDEDSYEYWISIPLVNNKFTRTDRNGNEVTYTVTTSGNNATVTWGSNSVTVEGSVSGGVLKYKWSSANALYNYEAPDANLASGAVKWDLSSVGTLLDGVTYSVSFRVYPSQKTLDTIADIKNDPNSWNTLDSNIKQYIDSNGNLKTNTTATLDYIDTRTNQAGHTTYTNPDPVPINTVESIVVSKKWANVVDDEEQPPVDLIVTRDGKDTYTVSLSDENSWKKTVFISIGIIDKNGVVLEGSEGHDFTFKEPGDLFYHWELDVPVVHPMLINGELTMLIKVDEKHPLPSGAKTYEINGSTYYVDETALSLTATNERRSQLDITKVVTGENPPADAIFPFTINVVNSNAPETEPTNDPNHDSDYWVWVSVRDANKTPITEGITGATHNSGGYWYTPSGTNITIPVMAGYSIRVLNLPSGSTYTIVEGELPIGFIFDSSELTSGTDKSFVAGRTTTGTIEKANTNYKVTFNNEYALIDVTVDKVWNDASNQDGKRPETLELTLNGVPTGVTVAAPTITESEDGNTWSYTWKAVPKYDSNGNTITYTVTEGTVPTGYTCATTTVNNGGTITNVHTPENTTVTVTKVWSDNSNQDGKRPETLELTLNNVPDGVTVTDPTITESQDGNSWTYIWSNLPKYNNGEEIEYTITETAVPEGYTCETKTVDNGGTITNVHTPENTTVTVTKVWSDNSNQDGKRPETLELTLNNVPDGVTVTAPTITESEDGNSWTYTWSNLPKYNNGVEIKYTVTEGTVPTGYTCETTTVDNGGTITNVHTPENTTVTVTKVWSDNSDQDGKRPETLELTLNGVPTGVTVPTPTITESQDGNSWTYIWSNLPKYNNGEEIEYTITETAVPEGYTCETKTVDNGGTITNVHTPENTTVTVTKVWNDNSDQDGKRPESLELTLNGVPTGVTVADPTITESQDGNSWTYTWSNLPKYNNGEEIKYTVTEGTVPTGYTCETTTVDNGGTITNVHAPENTTVTVTKVWDDASNQDGKRPETLELTLNNVPDGVTVTAPTITVSEDGNSWTYTWSNLPKYNNGEEIKYTVTEGTVPTGYTCETKTVDNGGTITNVHETEKTTVSVEKVWDDSNNKEGFRPENITITLLANGEEAGTITLNEENEWKHTFTELDKYADGKEIEYTVTEKKIDNYDEPKIVFDKEKDAFVVTNSRKYEETEITITKVWEDENNQDGIRPDSITVVLSNGDEVTLTKDENWTKKVTGLQKYVDGKEVVYTVVKELSVEGYEVTYSEDTLTITNTHTPEVTSVTVEKVWSDDNNESGKRPESVTIILLADDEDYRSVVLSEENEWKYTFEDLPVKQDGKEITYTVSEKDVPEDYVVSYEEVEGGFIIHNVLGQGGDEPPVNPQTGDNIILYLITLLISLIGIVSGKLYLRKSN